MRVPYRKPYEVVGFSYEADLHCLKCTYARFGPDVHVRQFADNEGNPVHPIFLESVHGVEHCGDCHQEIG